MGLGKAQLKKKIRLHFEGLQIIIPKFDLPNLKQILFNYVKYNKSHIPFIFFLAFN
jgi:hypothetical protein